VMYPQVPFRGTSPLQPVYDRVRAMAAAHRLAIPPAAWIRSAGTIAGRRDARWGETVQVPASATGRILETRDYYMAPGPSDIIATVADATGAHNGAAATIDIIDNATDQVIASGALALSATTGWKEIAVHIEIPGADGRAVRFRLTSPGSVAFALGSLDLPVDYGMTVVDLTEPLNTFDTHVSIFDAHPNERAQQVIARNVLEAIQIAESRH
jgi:hypothetical protein